MVKFSTIYCTFVLVFFSSILQAQPYLFKNASFEGPPGAQQLPPGWFDCGMAGQTPPDTHPSGAFNVVKGPQHGNTYIGLVVRGNETWEGVGQKTPVTFEQGVCYAFNIYLSRSDTYFSMSLKEGKNVDFTNPVVLRIWGGNSHCDRKELLKETKLIKHTDWKRYKIDFTPKNAIRYILIEAFYETPVIFPKRGNVLIDNLSPIVSCKEKIPESEPIAFNAPPVRPTPKPPVKPTPKPPVKPTPTPKQEAPKKETILDLDATKIKTGDIINVKDMFFLPDSIVPRAESYKVMDEIYNYLRANRNVKIEVRGHTNGIPSHDYCDKLSTKRAQSVAKYLIDKGINANRIIAKGYGKREPIDTNESKAGRMKNQRVEIKILSTGFR